MPVIGSPRQISDIDLMEIGREQLANWNGQAVIEGAVTHTWRGEPVGTVLGLVAALPGAEQMRCFMPRYAIRLRRGPTVLAEVAFCFRCRNGRAVSFQPDFDVPGWFTFDPDSTPARQLLSMFRAVGAAPDAGADAVATRPSPDSRVHNGSP
jgi:hypothetical protein